MRIFTELIAPVVFVAALFLFFVFLVVAVVNNLREKTAVEHKKMAPQL